MTKKKIDTYYVIDEEDGDELHVVEATGHEEAFCKAIHLDNYAPEPEDKAFYGTVFKASDAKRFKVTPELPQPQFTVEEVK